MCVFHSSRWLSWKCPRKVPRWRKIFTCAEFSCSRAKCFYWHSHAPVHRNYSCLSERAPCGVTSRNDIKQWTGPAPVGREDLRAACFHPQSPTHVIAHSRASHPWPESGGGVVSWWLRWSCGHVPRIARMNGQVRYPNISGFLRDRELLHSEKWNIQWLEFRFILR